MFKSFDNFAEIEADLAANAPSVVYKYRTWKDVHHKALLNDYEIYFAHPFSLNDPEEARPETEFDLNEIQDPRYFQKLLDSASSQPGAGNTRAEIRKLAEDKWEETKANPGLIIANQKAHNADKAFFDVFGIFSTGKSGLNGSLWQSLEYGDNHAGYCIGFKTVELCRHIQGGYGYVEYGDAPIKYSFFNKQSDPSGLYFKKLKWAVEEEFRFLTAGVGVYCDRYHYFQPDAVSEIILGYNMPVADRKEILDIIKNKYPAGLPVYETFLDAGGQLDKRRIQ